MVGKLHSQTIGAKITVQGPLNTRHAVSLMLATDTGISKTLQIRAKLKETVNLSRHRRVFDLMALRTIYRSKGRQG